MTTTYHPHQADLPRAVRVLPARPPLGHAVVDLMTQADDDLVEAAASDSPNDRYRAAHLAALRAAAAVLAGRPVQAATGRARRRRGPRSAWEDLPQVAPELAEWAVYFAGTAGKRAAAEAGLPSAVTAAEADDLLSQAEVFRGEVAMLLGLPYQQSMLGSVTRLVS